METSYEVLNELQEVSEHDPFTLDRYRQFFRHFPANAETILDVGCNTGRGGRVLKELAPTLKLSGLDCVAKRLEQISREIYDQLICSYTNNINAEDQSFNATVAGEFIEHLYPEDVMPTLSEFFRVLKPGGRLLLTTPNPNYVRLKLTGGSVLGGAHLSEHYQNQLSGKLKDVGFASVRIVGSGKVSRALGENVPALFLYGSYLAIAQKL